MRTFLGLILAVLLGATPAMAQSTQDTGGSHKAVKVIVGIGALAVGTIVAAKSSETTTITSAVGQSETSTFSSSQLITGLAIAGAGGIVLWDGLREHDRRAPSTSVVVAPSPKAARLLIRRRW